MTPDDLDARAKAFGEDILARGETTIIGTIPMHKPPNNPKTVFSTGEAAKICQVSQQTIIRCFDEGDIKGFLVPRSKFRRIPRESLIAFMKDNNIPTDALDAPARDERKPRKAVKR